MRIFLAFSAGILFCTLVFVLALQSGWIRTGNDIQVLESEISSLNQDLEQLRQNLDPAPVDSSSAQAHRSLPVPADDLKIKFKALKNSLEQSLATALRNNSVIVKYQDGWPKIALRNDLLFQSKSVNLKSSGRNALRKTAGVLRKFPETGFHIIGHVSSSRLAGNLARQYPSHRLLSMAQADAVADFLVAREGFDPALIMTAGMGYFQPLFPNDNQFHKALNSRIEIQLHPVKPQVLARAREIVRAEPVPAVVIPSKKSKPARLKRKMPKSIKPLHEDALKNIDEDKFDLGYEKH